MQIRNYKESTRKGGPKSRDERLIKHLQLHIIPEQHSPEVIATGMQPEQLEYEVCAKAIYNMTDRGLAPGASNESLWQKRMPDPIKPDRFKCKLSMANNP